MYQASAELSPHKSPTAARHIYLDATHTSSEQKIYSVMYRETIRKGHSSSRFSINELRALTGIRSENTVRRALRGLQKKLSVKQLEPHRGIYGPLYAVNQPHQIIEARRGAGIEIEPRTKQIAPKLAFTPATIPAATPSKNEPLTPSNFEGVAGAHHLLINHEENREGEQPSSSVVEGSADDEKLLEAQRLFEQLSGGGHWRADRDAEAFARIAGVPLWHIIMGLCYSAARCPQHHFNCLAYAVPAILDHYEQMKVFPDTEMLEIAYHTMRRTLNCLATGKWTIPEWEASSADQAK